MAGQWTNKTRHQPAMNARIPAAAVAAGSIALLLFLASHDVPSSGLPSEASRVPAFGSDADQRMLRSHHKGDPRTVRARSAVDLDGVGRDSSYATADDKSREHKQRAFEDELCIASVDDGTVATSSVVGPDDYGDLGAALALPGGHAADVLVECTGYARLEDPRGPTPERSRTLGTRAETTSLVGRGVAGVVEVGDGSLDPAATSRCDPFGHRPGYYDGAAGAWVDRCSGRATSFLEAVDGSEPRTRPPSKSCPVLEGRGGEGRGDDVWVLFVGDSVMRGWFLRAFLRDDMRLGRATEKEGPAPSAYHEAHPDYVQAALLPVDGDANPHVPRIWATYVWDETKFYKRKDEQKTTSAHFEKTPRTWGDFLERRKLNREGDLEPSFSRDKVPDIIFYGPGYHASMMGSDEYGAVVENTLGLWEEGYRVMLASEAGDDAPQRTMPRMHLLLNIMPAPWLIPEKYAGDREHRTLLNEHRKNLAIMEAARKRDGGGFVRGVVDAFSVELPYNGREGGDRSAHGDAVHVYEDYGWPVHSVVGNLLMNVICSGVY